MRYHMSPSNGSNSCFVHISVRQPLDLPTVTHTRVARNFRTATENTRTKLERTAFSINLELTSSSTAGLLQRLSQNVD